MQTFFPSGLSGFNSVLVFHSCHVRQKSQQCQQIRQLCADTCFCEFLCVHVRMHAFLTWEITMVIMWRNAFTNPSPLRRLAVVGVSYVCGWEWGREEWGRIRVQLSERVSKVCFSSVTLLWWSSLTPLRLANQKPKFRQYHGGTSNCHDHPSRCVQTSPNVVQCKDLRNVADKLR